MAGQSGPLTTDVALKGFMHVAETIAEGIALLHGNGTVAFINEAGATIMQRDCAEMHGKPFPMDTVSGETIIADLFDEEQKRTRFISITQQQLPLSLGGHSLVRMHDVTETELQNKALRESDMLYRSLISKSEEGMFIVQDGVVVFANEILARLMGFKTGDEFIGKTLTDVITPEDLPKALENHRKRLSGESVPQRYELNILHTDGHTIPVDLSVTLFNYKGRLSSLGTVRDLSARKKADETIRWKEALLEAVVRDNPLALYIIDFRTNLIQYANRKFISLWNIHHLEERLHNRQVDETELYPYMQSSVVDAKKFALKRKALRNQNNLEVMDDIIELVDGRTVRCISSPIHDVHHTLIGRLFIYEEITARMQAERELWKAKEKAEMSEKLKDAFIGNMSHEIRTPLNIIIGYTELLKTEFAKNPLDENGKMFESISSAGARLIRTVEHIMNISSIEAGAFPLHQVKLDVSDFVQTVGQRFASAAAEKGLTFDVNAPSSSVYAVADKYCLEHAITNIVDNAVKFTKQGGITIAVKQDGDWISIKIHDTGVGIAPEYLPKIFQPFSQEVSGIRRPFEGLGLGMRLTKYYVEANGGGLDIWSNKGTGTTVTLRFPVATETPAGISASEFAPRGTERPVVLVVEDDHTTQKFLKLLLSKRYAMQFASSAEQATIILAEHAIDIILMDISLHGDVDGIELTRRLRAAPAYETIPIIATTAHANASTRQASFDAGCDEFLIKPLDVDTLPAIIDQYIATHRAEEQKRDKLT